MRKLLNSSPIYPYPKLIGNYSNFIPISEIKGIFSVGTILSKESLTLYPKENTINLGRNSFHG